MFCEALHDEEDVYQGFLLYASLYGLKMDASQVRDRVHNYLHHNQPDETIDAAILAFFEDRILAPPDVILGRWGKSRVYELEAIPAGGWRHQVCESWFDAGCSFPPDQPVRLSHFWTDLCETVFSPDIPSGSRCSLRLTDDTIVHAVHRRQTVLGSLPQMLAKEIASTVDADVHYLALVDSLTNAHCRLIVTRAEAQVALDEVIEYAANAFTAPRNRC